MNEAELYDALIDAGVATAEELALVTMLNGFSEQTLNDVLFVRTGFRCWEQYAGEEEEEEEEA